MNLFDTHCHLTDAQFDEDRASVLARMREAGVTRALVVGDAANDPRAAVRLAGEHDFLWAAVGLHPHDASAWTEEMGGELTRLMAHPLAVAWGEIGLDYHYDLSPRETQKEVFARQLDMAWALGKPVILHIREAYADAADILRAACAAGRLPRGVMHCYTGEWEFARLCLDLGLYISFSGALTFKNCPVLVEVAKNMPLDRLLLETDCPYMAPVPMRGRRNEPAFVAYTATRAAEIRGLSPDALADAATQNGLRLFFPGGEPHNKNDGRKSS